MSRFQADAHEAIRPFVHSYWGFVRDLSAMQRFTVTPDAYLELIFFEEPPYVEEPTGVRQLAACTLIPLLDEPLRLIVPGMVRCASVRLYAWAAGLIFPQTDRAQESWYDAATDFADIAPAVRDALRLAAWDEIVAILDRRLLRTFGGARTAARTLPLVTEFVSPPVGERVTSATEVASKYDRSRRQVERHVRALTHRSPKQLASVRRFQMVRDTLWARPQSDLRALALEAGYADQSHLSRDFRRYANRSPLEFVRYCAQLRASLAGEDVAFFQDDPRTRAYTIPHEDSLGLDQSGSR